MKKVAIVGVEGSGKTVMLAGLGELYARPDANGYFLAPKNFQTASYVAGKIARMRRGEWPMATAEDVMQGLDWTLRRRQGEGERPKDVCEVSCLDFAGEVYRYAFVREKATPVGLLDEVASLKEYVRNADDLIVLINLRDIIVRGEHDSRVQEAMWITNAILSYALDDPNDRRPPRAAIVLSQADSYRDTIRACGGPKGVLAKYLPHVANNYDWLDIMAVSAVDRTVLDDDGNVVPAPDFQLGELRQVMDWILDGLVQGAPPYVSRPHSASQRPQRGNAPVPQRQLPPPSGIEQYMTLRGRANRASFWKFVGFVFLGLIVSSGVGDAPGLMLFILAMIWPSVSMAVRRLHDMDCSGWWLILGLIPCVNWVLVVILGFIAGTNENNSYGPKP